MRRFNGTLCQGFTAALRSAQPGIKQACLRALVDGYVAQNGCAGANEHIVMHFWVAVPSLLARAWPHEPSHSRHAQPWRRQEAKLPR